MWPGVVTGVIALKIFCSVVNASSFSKDENVNVKSLPYCHNKNGSGAIIVSTLDGKLSMLNSTGHLAWEIETGPGPLLVSNIHKLELTNNGEWVRIIPSLSGTLYKFDGSTIDPISISAETLLRSSFRYSDDLVIAGGIEVRTYGVGINTGNLQYECTQSKCSNHKQDELEDIIVVERSTQTIRAVEPRTGHERWNFSVGLHDIKLPQVSCINSKIFDMNISAIIPEGLLSVSFNKNILNESWQYKFCSPIVKVWKWDGLKISEVNLFEPSNMHGMVTPVNMPPSIYIGMHQKQLYIHESLQMRNLLQIPPSTDLVPAESEGITKIPWKPVAASTKALESSSTEDDSTALSVLNNSNYINGNGFYLYSEKELKEKDSAHCEKNDTVNKRIIIEEEEQGDNSKEGIIWYLRSYGRYYKEFFVMIVTLILSPLLLKLRKKGPLNQEIIIVEKPVSAEIIRSERQNSERSSEGFTSRFDNDFTLIQCLGRGGFGVVFQVKQNYDDCHYAIKRIPLPSEEKSRNRVMREVKALAKLDHQNIIRYFSSWIEHPPSGWEEEHDQTWIKSSYSTKNTFTESTTSPKKRSKSYSVSIDIPLFKRDDPSFDSQSTDEDDDDSYVVFENNCTQDVNENTSSLGTSKLGDDSFIVFANDSSKDSILNTTIRDCRPDQQFTKFTSQNYTVVAQDALEMTEHQQKKINWRRPGRKHYSWDSHSNLVQKSQPREPPVYLYIQMQLCQKESLKEWLSLHKERNYEHMKEIFLQILDAVEYVHLRKLIHRDLKPSNIFFSLDGQIKVGDFGLVKDFEGSLEMDMTRRSNANSFRGHTKEVGTTLYMSPEQSRGRAYDYKVDIYSLGIILFELLVPFSTDMERIKALTAIKINKYPEGFPEKYPAEHILLQNMLDENPSKRLTTIGIRAKEPFAKSNSVLGDDQHYSLKKFHKN